MDVIGIDGYYDVDGPDLGSKVLAWRKYLELASRLHQQYNRPIVFTEIGYCSGHCKRTHKPSRADYATHAEHYQAVFEAFRNVTYSGTSGNGWFLGSFWWNVRAQSSLRGQPYVRDANSPLIVPREARVSSGQSNATCCSGGFLADWVAISVLLCSGTQTTTVRQRALMIA